MYFVIAGGLLLAIGVGATGFLGVLRRRVRRESLLALTRERERVARDLHDHLAPHLSRIALAARLEDASCEAERSAKELREMIWDVHPANDTLASLFDFFADFAERHCGAAGISLELDLPTAPAFGTLPSGTRREISALYKEALQNVVCHAQAASVTVHACWNGRQLELSIRDDGRGFDPVEIERRSPCGPKAGHGLRNFQTRCRHLRGHCAILTAPGEGTTVSFLLPLTG
jgi:signal transduction histidine kinase